MRALVRRMAFAILALVGASGCGGGTDAGTCSSRADCAAGQICVDGSCHAATDAGPGLDAGMDAAPDATGCAVSCGTACCALRGERCFRDACIPDHGTCAAGGPCFADTSCVDGVCVPFGTDPVGDTDPACRREPAPLDSFDPELQCRWNAPDPTASNVIVNPLVIDLDGDAVPEVVFASFPTSGPRVTTIWAIRGDDCTDVWSSTTPDSNFVQTLVAGDLSGDGHPEVCGRTYAGLVFCLDHTGAFLWEGHDLIGTDHLVGASHHNVGLALVNVDGAGEPELVAGLTVFDGPTGVFLRGIEGALDTDYPQSTIWAIADVDGDGHAEALTGSGIYDLATATDEAAWGGQTGSTAVAELSAEHAGPEVVTVVTNVAGSMDGELRVNALDGSVLFRHAIPGGWGGPPTIADLDGDGFPELSAAGRGSISAFDLDCVAGVVIPPGSGRVCAVAGVTDGLMWTVATQDNSSGITGTSVFDFEGDGPVEIVYADECYARVFDGRDGSVKFSAPHNSGTWLEYPTIADADGDFFTEMIIPHANYYDPGCPAADPLRPEVTRAVVPTGVSIYRDRTDRWAPSRPLWNQHTGHITQIDDDATIPTSEVPSWTTHNSYRQAHPRAGGTALDTPDLTIGALAADDCNATTLVQPLAARVCNRGTLPVAAGIDVAFHDGAPDGPVVCAVVTTSTIEVGACVDVVCAWTDVPLEDERLVVAVVDGAAIVAECHDDNNAAALSVRCPPLVF